MPSHDLRPPPAVSELRVYPGEPVHCPHVRRLVRAALAHHTAIVDDAELVAAELFGNACRHTRSGEPGGTLALGISALPSGLAVVSVTDEGPTSAERLTGTDTWPELKSPTPGSPGWRGLHLVAAVADGWGHTPAEDMGLTVWAAFNLATLSLDGLTDRARL
ncbi:ATP-binding protein [Streptomonospora wellingtoniae]|uniref:ATP-binding protein n=1 Tax=Streptomonospora wellingtoniae TaxID=3075544 RepID=A0ABU2KTN5_9ACTN|nr:ATP-binding protein [Streptomonospora sp. DSM 45055]MDT0302654.1 ATP-binding protein [Streptomonospora sp. DSM 45055]